MTKKTISILIVALLICGLVWAAVVWRRPEARPEGLAVTTSIYPLYFLAAEIGGERVTLQNVVPAGAEAHDYEPTARDLANLTDSAVVILNGGGLEPWAENLTAVIGQAAELVFASEGLADRKIDHDGELETDPHIWLSPNLAAQMADKVAAALIKVDPDGKSYYEMNLVGLKDRLAILDSEFQYGLADCSRRDFVVSHAAFGYLADDYDLVQMPIAGLEPQAEPTPRELTELTEYVRASNIHYIFFEEMASPKLAETLAKEVGAATLVLNPIEGLSEAQIVVGQDYLSEMRNNLNNLKMALECR